MAGIYEPQIKKFEDGVQAIRDSVPDFSNVSSTVTQAPAARPRPTIGASAAAPAPGLAGSAAGAGAQVRRVAGAATGVAGNLAARGAIGVGSAADVVTAPVRAGAEAVNNFGRGIAGVPAQASNPAPFAQKAGQLVQGARALMSPRPRPVAVATSGGGGGAAGTPSRIRPRADFADVTSTVTQAPAGAPASTAGAGPTPIALKAGDVNTFTGSNGVTRAVPGLQASPAGPTSTTPVATATPTLAPRPVVSAQPAPRYAARGRQGGIIANPANGSVADQITRAMGSPSLKGSPSGRAAVAQAILQQAGFENDERQSALQTGDQADLGALASQARANEGAADRDLNAQQFNADLVERGADRTARSEDVRLARRPDVTVTADGTMGVVGPDGSFRPVTGADGKPVRGAQAPRETGALTEGDRLKSYTDRYNAILGMDSLSPEAAKAKQDALASLESDPLYAGLRGGGGAAPPAEAIAALKANPTAAAQFDEVFGPGASAQYLGN